MAFDGKYLDWNQKRIKGILDFYGSKFMFYKKILDLGCGHADISGVLHRLGADITAVDCRQEHLKIAEKKYSGIKTVKADLDRGWPFQNKSFDMILDLDIICHLRDYESHLKTICQYTRHLVIETAVCDSDDPNKCIKISENKNVYDLSGNGEGCRPTAAAIERILTECGMNFRRMDQERYNSGSYIYNWESKNDNSYDVNKRRLWYAVKNTSPVQFAAPPPAAIAPASINISPNLLPKLQNSHQVPRRRTRHVLTNPPPEPITILKEDSGNKKFVIVIPSYNNQRWCERNIQSALDQDYENYRIIFTDDCSKDDTFEKVSKVVSKSNKSEKVSLIKNKQRIGALENLYNMIHSCDDEEIILTLDGDDWLANNNVLNKLNEYYSSENIWMTYGQYKNHPNGEPGVSQQIPSNIIANNSYRQFTWCSSHLRTFYTWLFKMIKLEDLKYDGKFMSSAWDATIMYPQLEMAAYHAKFIPDILYIYNLDNPLNDHKVDVNLQQWFDHYVRTMPKYKPLTEKPVKNIGLMIIATGKYHRFIQGLISSADSFFLKNCNVSYYIFSDKHNDVQSSRRIVQIPIEHKSFPYASMDRFKHFINNSNKFINEDYLYYVDVDCLFVDEVSTEILGNLVGVQHCGFINGNGSFETNPKSNFYIEPSQYKKYYGGGFSGGKKDDYLKLAKWCYEHIEKDLDNGIMPVWHDETALNKYFFDHEPDVALSPSYHYPQNDIERFKKLWEPQIFYPKILLLDKNHEEIRK